MENNKFQKLSNKQMIGYSLGSIATGLIHFIFALYYVEFYYNDLKLLPLYFVIGQIIYGFVNSLNDPLFGQLTDRTNREKWGGRRIPYLKYGAPIYALVFILIWFPWNYGMPWSPEYQLIIFIQFVVMICAYDTMGTLLILCYLALLPEITAGTKDPTEYRNKINFLITLFGFLCVLILIFIIPGVKNTGLQPFQIANTIIAIIGMSAYWIVVVTTKERPEFQKDQVLPLWKSLKEAAKSKSFLLFVGYNFCQTLNTSVGLTYLFAYVFVLGGDPLTAVGLYFLVNIFVGYGSNILCMKLRSKWNMRTIILRFGFLRFLGTFIIFLLVLTPQSGILVWIGLIWSTFFAGYGVFTMSLFSLSVDEDEIKQGCRREGIFFGLNALLIRPADSLGPIIATIILESSGFLKDSFFQLPQALTGIKTLLFLVPAIISLIMLVFVYFYPFYDEKLKDLETQIMELHEKKLLEYKK